MATTIEESVLKERLMALLKESDLTTTTGEPSEGACFAACVGAFLRPYCIHKTVGRALGARISPVCGAFSLFFSNWGAFPAPPSLSTHRENDPQAAGAGALGRPVGQEGDDPR